MSESIVILTEEPLTGADVRNINSLREGTDAGLVVLVPADTERNLLVDFLENLSLLDVARAFRELGERGPNATEARAEASVALEASLAALRAAGAPVSGEVVEGDPVAALVAKVGQTGASQAVVVTRPHAISDTFHTDWANKAQHKLGLPVLHLYSGSGFIGDS
ncbi:hypothetical protein KIH31_05585 [Paenarthrobacter sp. DKR-5]|uniref:hypothetical protein n=1 Tax=Paenarthrobacter sp. DKR-5 TaxID=2835535 RepID=UPI001BDD3827|nr:hypothetical protein [Paenarthrobacter sp. DKR-5]MBT1002066.1 hypothetical protein [Paenarthrobacter sp. DKR-5]